MNVRDSKTRKPWQLLVATLAVLCGVMLPGHALAQVRSAVEGNTLPSEAIEPHAVEPPHDHAAHAAPVMSRQVHDAFAARVNLEDFRRLAVFEGGRAKILDTLAREQLERIYGKQRWKDADTGVTYDPVFTYLDLCFNNSYYNDKAIIYVEVLGLRRELVQTIPGDSAEREKWLRRGRLTPEMINSPRVAEIVMGMQADLTAQKAIQQLTRAVYTFRGPQSALLLVSPAPPATDWQHITDLNLASNWSFASNAAGATGPQPSARRVLEQFALLREAWRAGHADTVNAALAALTTEIPKLNPSSYPSDGRRGAELLYNQTRRFTIGYVAYFAATILLLLALAAPARRWLVRFGVAALLLGWAVHLAGIVVRGALAGRYWNIHNQYESFIAISWFAVTAGLIIMLVRRQWLFGAAASSVGTCALLFANTVDIPSSEVAQVAGILATSRILYVHVNMVLASYGLIGLGFFVSLMYLAVHYLQGRGAVKLAAAGLGEVELEDTRSAPSREALLGDLDRAQMVVLQLAFWILGMGVLMGAYWADHAWGRFWAWDPKETWALITWIIYLMVIHLRFAVKRRGLVTAWMSVLGFVVMLWTYWGVNLLLAGLHSYA